MRFVPLGVVVLAVVVAMTTPSCGATNLSCVDYGVWATYGPVDFEGPDSGYELIHELRH